MLRLADGDNCAAVVAELVEFRRLELMLSSEVELNQSRASDKQVFYNVHLRTGHKTLAPGWHKAQSLRYVVPIALLAQRLDAELKFRFEEDQYGLKALGILQSKLSDAQADILTGEGD